MPRRRIEHRMYWRDLDHLPGKDRGLLPILRAKGMDVLLDSEGVIVAAYGCEFRKQWLMSEASTLFVWEGEVELSSEERAAHEFLLGSHVPTPPEEIPHALHEGETYSYEKEKSKLLLDFAPRKISLED